MNDILPDDARGGIKLAHGIKLHARPASLDGSV